MADPESRPLSFEIERKFLVAEAPPGLEGYPHVTVRQGYLALDPNGAAVRVRQKGDRFFLAVKKGAGLRRTEAEIELARAQFDVLWPLTEGRRVEKIRYAIPCEGYVVELDVYGGALSGLLTAEVEFPSVAASAAFQPLSWMDRDVTDDARYKNKNLATCGVPRREE